GWARASAHCVSLDTSCRQIVYDEIAVGGFPEHGRKGAPTAGRGKMLCHDPGTAHVIDLALEQHAHGGRLGIAADHGAMGIAIYDRIPDHVDALPFHRVERFP